MRCVNCGKAVTLMTIKASALEPKAPTLVYFVTLRARDFRKRRVFVKRRETGRGSGAGKKPDLLLLTTPPQGECVHAGSYFNDGMKDIGKGFLRPYGFPIQIEFPGWRGGDDIYLAVRERRAVNGAHDFSHIVVGSRKDRSRD